MEITDFLKAARSRVWLIIGLPLVGAAFSVGVLLAQPVQYSATATVDPSTLVGAASSQYTGAQAVDQFVATFQATASGPKVRNAVATDTGTQPAAVTQGLDVTQRGGSASVLVTYTTTDRAKAEPVVKSATAHTLTAMFSSQVVMAQSQVASARKVLDEANATVEEFVTTNKMADPQKAYEAQLNRVNALVQQQAVLRANGNAVGAAALSASVTSANATLESFSKTLSAYNALTQRQSLAEQGVVTAQNTLDQATGQLDAAEPSIVAFFSGAQEIDRMQPTLQVAIAVAAAAFLFSLVLILVREVIRRGRAAALADITPEQSASVAGTGRQPADGAAASVSTAAGEQSPDEPQVESPPVAAAPAMDGKDRVVAGSRPR